MATATSRTGPQSITRVFALVGVAIAVFLAFSAYSIRKELQSSAQLAAIRDLYFPVLQRLDANIVRVDKMEELYIQVVVAGDRDLIGKAADMGTQADQAFDEVRKLYPGRDAAVARLRQQLNRYEELAGAASSGFLDQSGDPAVLAANMNAALEELRASLSGFRKASYDEFVTTLASSQRDASVRLWMGLALGVMNLGFMVVLVYFIRRNVAMMGVIAEQNATLERRVAERTAQLSQKTSDINAMLQNMKLGVSTVVPGNLIHPEYSNYLRTIFCIDDLANKDLVESLFSRSSLGVDAREQVQAAMAAILGEDPLMFDFNNHLLAREMTLSSDDGSQKIVQLDWSPIVSEESGTVEKVLLITQDVTQLRELEVASARQKEELDIIAKIIRIAAGKFNDFVDSAGGFITANRTLIEQRSGYDAETIAALFRNMHTIKGNARTFELSQITDAAHHAEQTYDRLRKDPGASWDAPLMLSELDAVAAAVARFVAVNEEKLGRRGRAAELLTARGYFVGNDELARLRAMTASLAAAHPGADMARLRHAVDVLGLISLERLVSGSVDALTSLAAELKKPTPAVDVAHGEFGFNNQFAEALKSSFVHILRNSLDHGIEPPEERRAADKPERGRVRFSCSQQAGTVELRISDDGRGLALHRLYEKGIAAGLFDAAHRPTREQVADVIFRSGLSTAAQVTQVSGRGVGLDAVRAFLRQQGAIIRIELKDSAADFGFAPFEFVIEAASTACAHSRAVAA
ncbi:MAG TPA: Hpt domain-containing protein [Steroidobacteraceae bacterium]|jgi:HPt (histidine-containing phosphotransfer) domain-containing protein|nr:Hpt domain-containing protein [Steroidobacteraceae bacterium]